MFFEQSVVAAVVTAGAWNESGMVKNLDRSGFTLNKCGAEFIANSCDAGASYIKFVVADSIKLIDNGRGVGTPSDFVNIFEIARENHGGDRSMGVSGSGGTTGGYQFSKKCCGTPSTEVIYTRAKNGPYMKATRPWSEICQTECYTGKIKITSMTDDEILEFDKDREHDEEKHGFTRKWEFSDSVSEVLEKQFDHDEKDLPIRLMMNSNERWDLIFGHMQINISLVKSDGSRPKVLPKYDYFGGEDNKYYTGTNVETIHHYTDDKNDNRFVWEDQTSDKNYEFKKNKKTTNKIISEVAIHPLWKHNGTIEIYNGMRKNPKIFDETSPNPRKLDSAECFLSDYEESHFHLESQKDNIRDYIGKTRLYRNGQGITGFLLEGYNVGAARGNAGSMMKSFHHRTEIQYSTLSTQNNPTDNAFGIQSNKNQNQNVLPDNLERMVGHLRKRNFDKIIGHFDEVIDHVKETKRLAAEERKQAALAVLALAEAALAEAALAEAAAAEEEEEEQSTAPLSQQSVAVLQVEEEEEDDDDQFEDASDDDGQDCAVGPDVEADVEAETEPNAEVQFVLEPEQEEEEEEEQEQDPLVTKQLLLQLLQEKINENTEESKMMDIYNMLISM